MILQALHDFVWHPLEGEAKPPAKNGGHVQMDDVLDDRNPYFKLIPGGETSNISFIHPYLAKQ